MKPALLIVVPALLARVACAGAGGGGGGADSGPPATDGGARPAVCGDGFVDWPEVCDDGNATGSDVCSADCDQAYAVQGWGPLTGKVDILFVVDNSGSMCEEQIALRDGFQSFIDGLTSRGGVDFHIGVITTDTMDPAQSGALQNWPRPPVADQDCLTPLPPEEDCTTGLPSPLPRVLTPGTPELARTLRCISQVGIDGFGGESALAAVELALRPPLAAPGGLNAGFLRPDAFLAIIFVGDEDDCSVCDDPSFGGCQFLPSITQNLDCSIWLSDSLTPVDAFVDMMRARKPSGQVFVASIIGLDATGSSAGPILPDPDTTNHPDELLPICESAFGRAAPAPRLETYTRAFEPLYDLESICAADFGSPLLAMGERLASAATDYCLTGLPCPGLTSAEIRVVIDAGEGPVVLREGEYWLVADDVCPSGQRLAFLDVPARDASVSATYPVTTVPGVACNGD